MTESCLSERLRRCRGEADITSILAARSLLWMIGTLAVVATLWLTLLSGGEGRAPVVTPGGTSAPSGASSGATAGGGYGSAIGAAHGAIQQSNQDAQRAAGSPAGTP